MRSKIVVFLLFFLPLVVLPFGGSYFETPKVLIAEFLIEILIILTFIQQKSLQIKRLSPWQASLLGALFLLTLIQLLFLAPTEAAFFGNVIRLQGIFLLWHLLIFSILSAQIPINLFEKKIFTLSLELVFLTLFFFGQDQAGRYVGSLGEANALAAVAVFIFPFVYFKNRLPGRLLSILAVSLIVLVTGSRAGMVALFIQGVFLILYKYLKLSFLKASLIGLFLCGFSLLLPLGESALTANTPYSYQFEVRSQVWQSAAVTGLSHPWLGVGFGNIQNSLHQTSLQLNNNIQYVVVDSSHNFLLDYFVQGGLPALVIILILLFFTIKYFIRNESTLKLTALLGILATISFNPTSVSVLLALWWLIGQGFSISKIHHNS